ncbi:glycosyltransferase [Aquincola tertiaricarbonis]|uniref:Glycosyltransferase n=1 Tax=Aquincola tertiaricarbonis TaxID=391953 RepID=A0ABY4SBQ7_AQUTE|nr:glycosyltransferase [Aquincola tertiaricarbonis]URI09506.1 glycosyltransferase [Aquincola tertiaricarbonis]
MTTQFMDVRGYRHSVYHCVDEVRAQPGMPVAEIEQAERRLMKDVEFCFVTAQSLLDARRQENPNTYYFPNVAEFEHFAKARSDLLPPPLDIGPRTKPRIGFIGAISSYKVDFQLLCKMASMHKDWEIILIGQVGEGDPSTNVSMLSEYENILLIGPRDYKDLPAYLKTFDVAVLPCLINDYTRGMFPMKFFEYLAAGKPVVSTDLHALRSYADIAVIADSHEAFLRGVEDAVDGKVPPIERRIAAAKEQTYEIRTDKMLALIAETSGSAL